MSPETLALLAELLDHVQLQVSHPEFEQQAQRVIVAKRELAQAFTAADDCCGRDEPISATATE